MKDFIIYLQSKPPSVPTKEKYSIEELKNLPASSSIRELELVREGQLSLLRKTENLQVFNFSGEFQQPKPQAANEVAYLPMTFDIWQQRRGHFVVSFKAPKKLSKAVIALLSYATQGDPFLIRSVQLSKANFLDLSKYVLSCGGDIRQYIFWDNMGVHDDEARVNQSRKSGVGLEKSADFKRDITAFRKIRMLGFSYKSSPDSRDIRFRMIDWGGGQFYSPSDPVDHEILEFLDVFNKTIIPQTPL